jgi:dTDP-4-amino-4,6-dideoxygalactose transaminase
VYHLFPVLSPARDTVRRHLEIAGIETLVHYPVPIPRQRAIGSSDACPVADRVCGEVFSLPLYPGLPPDTVSRVAAALHAAAAAAPER